MLYNIIKQLITFIGYLTKQMLKYIGDCNTCKSAFVTPQVYSEHLCASLVNMKTKGRLIHPNIYFFDFIKKIENSFNKYSSSTHVFELIVTYLMSENTINFRCSSHGGDVISFTVMYYIRMRMRKFSQQENKKKKKDNRNKKKIAKFSKT